MKLKLNHTAGLGLPPAPSTKQQPNARFGMGQHLEPGINDVDDEYFAAVKDNPTVLAWMKGGQLEVVSDKRGGK